MKEKEQVITKFIYDLCTIVNKGDLLNMSINIKTMFYYTDIIDMEKEILETTQNIIHRIYCFYTDNPQLIEEIIFEHKL